MLSNLEFCNRLFIRVIVMGAVVVLFLRLFGIIDLWPSSKVKDNTKQIEEETLLSVDILPERVREIHIISGYAQFLPTDKYLYLQLNSLMGARILFAASGDEIDDLWRLGEMITIGNEYKITVKEQKQKDGVWVIVDLRYEDNGEEGENG